MNTFKEFHEQRILSEAAFVLPAIPYLVGAASTLKSLAVSVVVSKLGYDALTSDAVKEAAQAITSGGVEVMPLTTASPEIVVDAIAPFVTAEGTVAVTTESTSVISSALGIGEAVVQSVLAFGASMGLSPLAVGIIFGAGLTLTIGGGYMYYKNNGPKKFKKLLKKALKYLVSALLYVGHIAIKLFMAAGNSLAGAIGSAIGATVTAIAGGAVALVKKVAKKLKKEGKEEDKEKIRDLENFQLTS